MPPKRKAKFYQEDAKKKGVVLSEVKLKVCQKEIWDNLLKGTDAKKAGYFIRNQVKTMPLQSLQLIIDIIKLHHEKEAWHEVKLIEDPIFAVHFMNCLTDRAVQNDCADLERFRDNGLGALLVYIHRKHPSDSEVAFHVCNNISKLLHPHPKAGSLAFVDEVTKRLIKILRDCNTEQYDFYSSLKSQRPAGSQKSATNVYNPVPSSEPIMELACDALANAIFAKPDCAGLLLSYEQSMGAAQLCAALQVYKASTQVCSRVISVFMKISAEVPETLLRQFLEPFPRGEEAATHGGEKEAKKPPPDATNTGSKPPDILHKVLSTVFRCSKDNGGRRSNGRKSRQDYSIETEDENRRESKRDLIANAFIFLYNVCLVSETCKMKIMRWFPMLLHLAIQEMDSATIQLHFLGVCYELLVVESEEQDLGSYLEEIRKWVQDVGTIHGGGQSTLVPGNNAVVKVATGEVEENAEVCKEILDWAFHVSMQILRKLSPECREVRCAPKKRQQNEIDGHSATTQPNVDEALRFSSTQDTTSSLPAPNANAAKKSRCDPPGEYLTDAKVNDGATGNRTPRAGRTPGVDHDGKAVEGGKSDATTSANAGSNTLFSFSTTGSERRSGGEPDISNKHTMANGKTLEKKADLSCFSEPMERPLQDRCASNVPNLTEVDNLARDNAAVVQTEVCDRYAAAMAEAGDAQNSSKGSSTSLPDSEKPESEEDLSKGAHATESVSARTHAHSTAGVEQCVEPSNAGKCSTEGDQTKTAPFIDLLDHSSVKKNETPTDPMANDSTFCTEEAPGSDQSENDTDRTSVNESGSEVSPTDQVALLSVDSVPCSPDSKGTPTFDTPRHRSEKLRFVDDSVDSNDQDKQDGDVLCAAVSGSADVGKLEQDNTEAAQPRKADDVERTSSSPVPLPANEHILYEENTVWRHAIVLDRDEEVTKWNWFYSWYFEGNDSLFNPSMTEKTNTMVIDESIPNGVTTKKPKKKRRKI